MKKIIMMSLLLTAATGMISSAQANKRKCVASYVAPMLQKGKMDKEDFMALHENGSKRRYGMEVNGKKVPAHMAVPTEALLNDAKTAAMKTNWVPSKNPSQEKCEIELTHGNGKKTKVTLYPYAKEKKSKA